MTDTNEQLALAPVADSGAEPGTATAKGGAKRKSGSLSAMLLPELQQLAGSMGIASAKLRKSELIAAIQAGRSGGSGGTSGAAATATASSEAPASRPERARREPRNNADGDTAGSAGAQRRERAPRGDNAEARTEGGQARNGEPRNTESRNAEGRNAEGRNEGRSNEGRNNEARSEPGGDGEQGQNRQRNGNQRQNFGGQNRQGGNQNRNQGGQGGQDRQDRQGGQNRQGGNQNRNNEGGQDRPDRQGGNGPNVDADDDFDSRGRRGRRYRDRRGRNRERPGGGNADVEPTISDDDVLVPVAGIVDCIEDKNAWFVRTGGYFASPDDVYVSNTYVRRFGLRRGDAVTGAIKQQREGERREKYTPLVRLDTINGRDPEQSKNRVEFTKLTPLYPQQRLRLETEPHILTTRVIDLVMPIGKGQRALIASPPKAGKTMVLQAIANAIATNNPEVHLMVVLVDERPEEVTDMQRSVKGEVIASTFDRRPQDHTMVAELAIERAKRLVEMGHDVVVLLDSITRLGRAYNLAAPASGRILSGGVDSTALYPPKRFLGAARNIENGGSLTILATALVETGSAGDSVIFEEFKGTGNAELKLDRKIADKRIFPAIDVDQSSTRKEELLLSPDERVVTIKLRRVLQSLEQQEALNLLLDRLKKTSTNTEFLMQIAKTTPGQD